MSEKLAEALQTRYGPIAFGCICLIVLHYTIFGPTLASFSRGSEALQTASASMAAVASDTKLIVGRQEHSLSELRRVAQLLDQTTEAVNRLHEVTHAR